MEETVFDTAHEKLEKESNLIIKKLARLEKIKLALNVLLSIFVFVVMWMLGSAVILALWKLLTFIYNL